MGKADLHLHTNRTDGANSPKEMVKEAVNAGLDIIAITDHGLIKPAFEAQEFALKNKLPIEIIIGEEIPTNEGEIIGLFIKKQIPSFIDIYQAIKLIKEQGGLVIIPHPMRIFLGYSLWSKTIDKLSKEKLIDGIEIHNFWDHNPNLYKMRLKRNKKWQLAEIGSTDSHHVNTVGKIYTEFPGKTASDLRKAIENRTTMAIEKTSRLSKMAKTITQSLRVLINGKPNFPGNVKKSTKIKHMIKFITQQR